MMVTTVNPQKVGYIGYYYTDRACSGSPVLSPLSYQYVIPGGSVISWRGPRNRCSNDFSLAKYNVNGQKAIKLCMTNGCWAGGPEWMYFLWGQMGSVHKALGAEFQDFLDDSSFLLNRDYMISKLMSKAHAAKFDGASQLAELGETIVYLHRLLTDLESICKLAKRLKGYGQSSFGSAWLEYRYAIMPIILTIKDLLDLNKPFRTNIFSRYIIPAHTTKKSYDWVSSANGFYFRSAVTDSIKTAGRVKILQRYDPHPYGFGLQDVVMAAWEVTPLSFVVDWFLGVQNWLTSLRNVEMTIKDKYVTVIHNRHVDIWIDRERSVCIKDVFEMPTRDNPLKVDMVHVARFANASMVTPAVPIPNPMPLSLLHTLDAASLIITRLLR